MVTHHSFTGFASVNSARRLQSVNPSFNENSMPNLNANRRSEPNASSKRIFSSPLVSTVLIGQGMIALCVGVGLRMANFGLPRPVLADIAAGGLLMVGLVMLALSFWIRQRALTEFRRSRDD